MAETVIRPASPAHELAIELIDTHHEHLQTARILWLFTSSKRTRGGHVVLGSSSRSNPLQRYLSAQAETTLPPADYVVLIDEARWKRSLQTQKLALIDHLLCTMVQRETVNRRSGEITKTWATVGPDINEFAAVIERHGVWLPEQQIMAKAMRSVAAGTLKLRFPDLEEDPAEAPVDRGEERETTVDDQGLVQSTRRVPKRHHTLGPDPTPPPPGYSELFGDHGMGPLPDAAEPLEPAEGPDVPTLADEPPDERSPQANADDETLPWERRAGITSEAEADQRRRSRQVTDTQRAAGVGSSA